jgi:hypothetical protein
MGSGPESSAARSYLMLINDFLSAALPKPTVNQGAKPSRTAELFDGFSSNSRGISRCQPANKSRGNGMVAEDVDESTSVAPSDDPVVFKDAACYPRIDPPDRSKTKQPDRRSHLADPSVIPVMTFSAHDAQFSESLPR